MAFQTWTVAVAALFGIGPTAGKGAPERSHRKLFLGRMGMEGQGTVESFGGPFAEESLG